MKNKKNTLRVDTGRRHFFRRFLGETACFIDELRGRPQKKLSELDQVPDHIVRKMIPIKNQSDHYQFNNNILLIRDKDIGEFQEVLELNLREKEIVELFDNEYDYNLQEIASLLNGESGEQSEDIYQEVKKLFIKLAKHAVYFPAEPQYDNQ
jgi:hypothetical protein